MKTAMGFASVLACACSLAAQIDTSLQRLANGMDEVRIRNSSAASLSTFVVTVSQVPRGDYSSNAPLVVYSDPLIDPEAKPLAARDERVVIAVGVVPAGPDSLGRPRCSGECSRLEQPIFAAGIFANGATTGDAALLGRLILRRCNMLQAVETALDTLSDAGRHNVPRGRLVDQFKRMANSLNRWYLPPEEQVGRILYQSIAGKLLDLAEPELGAPFPPDAFVAQETATLNQMRVAILESQPSLTEAAVIRR